MYVNIAGCERYRSITTGHYRRAVGAVLIYDITNEESFKNLTYWTQELKAHADSEIVIALLANKCDIMFTNPSKREVLKEAALKFSQDYDLIFYDESSALADINITPLFEKLIVSTIK